MPQETYDADRVRQLAIELGDGWSIAGVVLARGETAWNPASTKGPLYGPSVIEYVMHKTGISAYEFDATAGCLSSDKCTTPRESGTTRCPEHALSRYAQVN